MAPGGAGASHPGVSCCDELLLSKQPRHLCWLASPLQSTPEMAAAVAGAHRLYEKLQVSQLATCAEVVGWEADCAAFWVTEAALDKVDWACWAPSLPAECSPRMHGRHTKRLPPVPLPCPQMPRTDWSLQTMGTSSHGSSGRSGVPPAAQSGTQSAVGRDVTAGSPAPAAQSVEAPAAGPVLSSALSPRGHPAGGSLMQPASSASGATKQAQQGPGSPAVPAGPPGAAGGPAPQPAHALQAPGAAAALAAVASEPGPGPQSAPMASGGMASSA